MMTKVIPFSRFRVIFPIISFVLIAAGLIYTFTTGGLNLGIDFQPGLNIRLQIAPVGARVSYVGDGTSTINIRQGELTVATTTADGTTRSSFLLDEYANVTALQTELRSIPGLSLESVDSDETNYIDLERETELSSIPIYLNFAPGENDGVEIGAVRNAIAQVGDPQIQTIGDSMANEFMIRIEEAAGATDFDSEVTVEVARLLESEFGAGTVMIRQTDYVGARFSANLAQQSVYLSVLALLLILAYTWFRFRLAYAISAITALIHDSMFMFAFIGLTGLEFSTATVAAVLTIIGYSLNDTIVIFDRVRENTTLLRDDPFRSIVDTSITQSLGRTIMTSITTLLAVVAIFIFGTGSIRDFALSMIVGVIVGTYSSIFVASPILTGWTSIALVRRKHREAERFHVAGSDDVAKSETAPEKETAETKGDSAAAPEVIPMAERKLKGKRKNR